MPKRRHIKKGEPLAILPDALHSDSSAMWWDSLTDVPDNERCDTVTVVHVRGSLDHHKGFGCDSYEGILERVASALAGDSEDLPPRCVVLRIDSPGGVVSGLNETVFALRKMSQKANIPLIAYVDELAASAAYALACACVEIYVPPSGITGSVGVISTLYDVTAADEMAGVRFVTLTSGDRKADGHPHVPISESALSAEQKRVDRLAIQFFKLVSAARPVSVNEIEGFQAGIFLGKEAVRNGLADDVMGWDDLLAALNDKKTIDVSALGRSTSKPPKVIPLRVDPRDGPAGKRENEMSLLALQTLVKRTKASIESEKDPKKKKTFAASLVTYKAALEAYKKEKYTKETQEMEESSEDDEEAAESEESAESEEESSEAKGNETDRKEKKSSKKAGSDDSDDEDEGDDDEASESKKASAALATLASQVTGKSGKAAVGALAAMLAQGQRAAAMVDEITRERRAEKKAASIESALNARRITKHEAKTLKDKPLSFVSSFLEMRPKAIINVDDDTIRIPDPNAKAGDGAGLSAEVSAAVDMAVSAAPEGVDKVALRKSMFEAHEKRMAAGLNGAGRY